MANTTIGNLIDTLRQLALLDAAQLAELERSRQRFADTKTLLQSLGKQGWLTRWQAKQLYNGRGADLALGQYTILEPLGEGGMGEVFKAKQRNLNRLVAIKVIRQDRLGNADALKRFQREIRAVSQLAHPNVVRAYDADQIGDRHIFVMEYADGADLAHVVEQQGALPIPLACDYVRQAALGLQHAHDRGLVHRDIKPSNLLLTKTGEKGSPGLVKLLDLGLSRLRESQNNETIDQTMTRDGSVVGTPDYMAPEQARDSHTVDIRADIYSLGCTLYYLLAGAVPYPGGTGMEKVFKHQLEEPEPIERLRKDIPRALAAIVRKMMAKTPEQRYQTPVEVARVLEPFAPTSAAAFQESLKPAPASGRRLSAARAASETPAQGTATRKDLAAEARRGRGGRRFAVFVVICLLLTGAVGTAYWLRPSPSSVDAAPTDRGSVPADTGRTVQTTPPVGVAAAEWTLGDARYRHWGTAVRVAVSPDGKLASGGSDHVIRFWDPTTGQETAALRGHTGPIVALAFSPDGQLLASGSMDHTVRLWDVATGRELHCFKDHAKDVYAVAFSPDKVTLASGSDNRIVKLWDLGTYRSRATLTLPGSVRGLSFSSDGKLLAAAAILGSTTPACDVRVFDARTGNASPIYNFSYQNCAQASVAFSPTQPTVLALGLSPTLAGAPRGLVYLEQLANRKESTQFNETGPIQTLTFLSDGESLVVALPDALKAYAVTGKPTIRYNHPGRSAGAIQSLAALKDGKTLVSGHADCALRLWDLERGLSPATPASPASPWRHLTFSADGQLIAGTSEVDTLVRLWDLRTRKERWTMRGPDGGVQTLCISGDGKHVLAGSVTGLMAFQSMGGQRLGAINDDTWSSVCALSPDGSHAALLNQPQGITLHEFPSGKLLHTLVGHSKGATQGAFSPDGKTLASVGGEGALRLWDVPSRNSRATLGGLPAFASALAYSSDGTTLAGAFSPPGPNGPGEVRLWNASTGKESTRTTEPGGLIFDLLIHPQGKAVVYSNKNGLKVWDTASNQKWSPPEIGAGRPNAVALSPDGQLLAAVFSGRLLVWDLAGRNMQVELSLAGPVHSLAFTPDSQRLLTANGNSTLSAYRMGRK